MSAVKNLISIFIADRNVMGSQLLAESLGRDPRFEVAAIAPAPKILSLVPTKPGVAVISAELDSGSTKGFYLARSLRARTRALSIVMLLESLEREGVIAAFRSGAKGIFCRSEPISELRCCIEHVSEGRIWVGHSEAEYLLEALQSAPSCDGVAEITSLTKRETAVAELAGQGLSNKQIAWKLNLSEHTVKNHLFRIFDKLDVSNRVELLFAMVYGRNSHFGELALRLLFEQRPRESACIAAAEDGFIPAQFMLGMAYLEGKGVEKNDHAAYYWLRMAELNSKNLLEQSRAGINELSSSLIPQDIQMLEQQILEKVQEHQKRTSERVSEGFQPEGIKIHRLAS